MDLDKNQSSAPLVGCTSMGRRREVYFQRFNVLEYGQSFNFPPKAAVLNRLRGRAPDGFSFYMRAWQLITHEASSPTYKNIPGELKGDPAGFGAFKDSPEVDNAWRNTLRAARRLGARGVLFATPAAFTPTAQNRKNLARFFANIAEGEAQDLQLIWEPAGLWATEEVEALAHDLGVLPCWDPLAREVYPGGDAAYLRVTNLGMARTPTVSDLAYLAERLSDYREATCIMDTPSMFSDGQRLLELLGG